MKKLTYIRVEDMPTEAEHREEIDATCMTTWKKGYNKCLEEALANKRELSVEGLAKVIQNSIDTEDYKEIQEGCYSGEDLAEAIINYLGESNEG